jgi:hypothetical protein
LLTVIAMRINSGIRAKNHLNACLYRFCEAITLRF